MKQLEKNTRFSQSRLWDYQRAYFEKQGIDAWAGQVPFYITSNPFIAARYAEVFAHFFMDIVRRGEYDTSQPVYILELGTGSGRFSYYCLKALARLHAQWQCPVKYCYVLSDFTQRNVDFWKQHSRLIPFFDAGTADVALFDMDNDVDVTLQYCKQTLTPQSLVNPLCVIANYVFDTVSSDVFRAQQGRLFEAAVNLETPLDNYQHGKVQQLDKLKATFSYGDLPVSYYDDVLLDETLQSYQHRLTTATFLLPIGGLRALQRLQTLSSGRLFVLSTDKGFTTLDELEGRSDPSVVFHGSFSMSVNFHAIGEYAIKCGGDAYFQRLRKGIKTCAFMFGSDFKALPLTRAALENTMDALSPGDYFHFHEFMKKTNEHMDIKMMVSYLLFSRWDPHVFTFFVDALARGLPQADRVTVESVLGGMPLLAENIFVMPGAHDAYFDIGIIFHAVGRYAEALHYYEVSARHFPPYYLLRFNQGLCHYFLGNKPSALLCFQQALSCDSGDVSLADQWIARITSEINPQ